MGMMKILIVNKDCKDCIQRVELRVCKYEWQEVMEVEIPFKEGYLLFPPQGVLGHLKKSWHKRYCQLFKSSKHGIERLEVFDSEDDLWKNSTIRIITLENCIKITQDVQKHPNVFTIVTKTNVHHFATLSERELGDWITAFQIIAFKDNVSKQTIEEDNDLYCSSADGVFAVKLVASDASSRCGLEPGPYTLVISSAAIQLRDGRDHRMLCTWPYRYIRRYGYREGKFTFEAGRKCETGEGTFHLEHSNQQEIFRCMSGKMKNMRKLLSGDPPPAPAIVCGDSQFQAALSMEARSRSPLPPSPTGAAPYLELEYGAAPPASKQLVFALTDAAKKPKPVKPPRKSLLLAGTDRSEELTVDSGASGRLKGQLLEPPALALPATPPPGKSYDTVEVRKEAWRTLGVGEVSHSEKPFPESDVEEDGLESILLHSSQHSSSEPMVKTQGSKILLSQPAVRLDASENYDTLQHFGSTSKLNSNPGYRQIPAVSTAVASVTSPTDPAPPLHAHGLYNTVTEGMQACRLADDSHYGYGMIRKKTATNESEEQESGPNHKLYNDLEYAVVQKPKRV